MCWKRHGLEVFEIICMTSIYGIFEHIYESSSSVRLCPIKLIQDNISSFQWYQRKSIEIINMESQFIYKRKNHLGNILLVIFLSQWKYHLRYIPLSIAKMEQFEPIREWPELLNTQPLPQTLYVRIRTYIAAVSGWRSRKVRGENIKSCERSRCTSFQR